MPGRDELIQKNIDAARASVNNNVNSAVEQSKTVGETPVGSSHRSLLGGNLDVISALDTIEFAQKGPLGDGALRNSIAYIRYWSRAGSKSTAETSTQTIDATQIDPGSDPQAELQKAVNDIAGPEMENVESVEYSDDFRTAYITNADGSEIRVNSYITDDGKVVQTSIDSSTLVLDEDGNIISGERGTVFAKANEKLSVDQTAQGERQQAIATQTPKTKDAPATGRDELIQRNIANASQKMIEESVIMSRTSGVGQLKPANPNGFVNILGKIGKSILGVSPSKISYAGVAGSAVKGAAKVEKSGTLAKGMWQFLFNPSELEIEAGPEFRVAETWGVSDKANSGQPLNWSHNKNAQLKFNSVLLNGYMFGRKVEELEQGIFELFMSRDGEGQDGPPVLEFVWGKRVFGPCVIKDISVREKMWDEGQVVNAELSFTLEQIPEWTINDGFVDIARPGRIPNIYDAVNGDASETTTPDGSQTNVPPGATNEPAAQPPTGQKPNAQNGLTPTQLYRKCQDAGVFADKFKKLEGKIMAASTGGAEPPLKQRLYQLRGEYIREYTSASRILGSELTSRSTYPNVTPSKLIQAMDTAIASEDAKTGLNALTRNYFNAQSILQNAANSAYNASKAFSQSTVCVAERKKVDAVTDQQEADRVCRNKQAGGQCSWFNLSAGGRIKSCSGVELICGADGYLKNASTYRP